MVTEMMPRSFTSLGDGNWGQAEALNLLFTRAVELITLYPRSVIANHPVSLSSMDVETTSAIPHLIFGGGIVRGCTVLCVIDTYGHRWDTDKRSCFLCSKQHVHAVGDDAHLQFYPGLLA